LVDSVEKLKLIFRILKDVNKYENEVNRWVDWWVGG
jgi:hypothetical protein